MRILLTSLPLVPLKEVGQSFSVTRERARQIEASALKKLQTPIRMMQLASILT